MHFFYDHLDSDIKKILLSQIRNAWTHHSTSLEGNSLTLGETDFILEEGLTIQGKPLKDHNEVYGHAKAIEWIYTQLKSPAPITKQDLFRLHQMVLTELIMDIDQPVGQWKSQSNFTTYIENNKQAWREYPAPQFIDQLMKQWIEMLNTSLNQDLNQAEAMACYADLQLTFVSIHPFFDGNGRMARIMMNAELVATDLHKIIVPSVHRESYLNGMHKATRQSKFRTIVKVMHQLQCYTASLPWEDYGEARASLELHAADKEPERHP